MPPKYDSTTLKIVAAEKRVSTPSIVEPLFKPEELHDGVEATDRNYVQEACFELRNVEKRVKEGGLS
jgi:hypothetical protein